MAGSRVTSACGDDPGSVSPGRTEDVQFNVGGQLDLLKTVAPRLSPQPLLLCFPLSACSRVPRLSLASSPSCPASVRSFDDVIALENKAVTTRVKKQSRLSTSLSHALFEALRGRLSGPQPVSFDVFVTNLETKAQAALQSADSCDVCERAGGEEGAEGLEASRSLKKKRGEKAGKSDRRTAARRTIAVCVVPQLDPANGRVMLTPPQRVCEACFRIVHLPHLLAVSVASVVSAAPLSRSVFSEVLEHFAAVNGYSSLSVAGARLQQAISLAFSVSLLKKQVNWRLERLAYPSLDAFFSSLGSDASPSPRTRDIRIQNCPIEDVSPNGVPPSNVSKGEQKKISLQRTVLAKRRRQGPTDANKHSATDDTSHKQAEDLDVETSTKREKVKKSAGFCEKVAAKNDQARNQVVNNSQQSRKGKKRKQTA
ncbi:hypothetical protein TGARI_234390 [Toxoplasma gondii ARI]|uniref:Uncharacterized protein n=1 Tax=Toxoplasma gondii ARI TaxID=1074872 RepID=A0A139XU84_TOXGO|nr:hypothetical protein TGARI_234390 [Toxoplasma gondii ARI]